MTNYWTLTDEMRDMYLPMVTEAIENMQAGKAEVVDFTNTHLSPTLLGDILKLLGFEFSYGDSNGWQIDFDFFYEREGDGTSVSVEGCAATFEVRLRVV